jgi:hypothetical protein
MWGDCGTAQLWIEADGGNVELKANWVSVNLCQENYNKIFIHLNHLSSKRLKYQASDFYLTFHVCFD